MPPHFEGFSVGTEIEKSKVISAAPAFPNPALQAIQEASYLYGPETRVCLLLSLGYGGSMRQHVGGDDKLVRAEVTAHELERRWGTTGLYYRLSVIPSISALESTTQETLGSISAHTSDYLLNPVTDRVLDQVAKASCRNRRFTLRGLAQVTAPPKVSFSGLPPLSPYYVQRDIPMNHMVVSLLGSEVDERQRVLTLTGMGGSGKTQMVIAFIREHGDCFQNVLFVDASSEQTIETGLVTRLRSIDKSFQGADLTSALEALAQPNEIITTKWCIVFDNADDPKVNITEFFPLCDHGAIIITSRNAQLESISPNDTITLEVMTKDEACEVLFSSIGIKDSWRPHHRQLALDIVKEFEYLPIAVVQAGCYIRKYKCLDTYLRRLEASRSDLLKHTSMQRDKLRYKHSVYAAFDISLTSLLAASKEFMHEEYKLMDRGHDFQEAVNLLRLIITPKGKFDEVEVDSIIEELQQSSLVSLVPLESDVKLRFHLLIHAWAYDRQNDEERKKYRDAALRLLTSLVDGDDGVYIDSDLEPHARRFIEEITMLHVNDQSSLVEVWLTKPKDQVKLKVLEDIYQTVRAAYGDSDLRTSTAHLVLCVMGFRETLDTARAEAIARQEYELRKAISGPRTLATTEAMFLLACFIDFSFARKEEAMELFHTTLEIQQETLGPDHLDTIKTMDMLATSLIRADHGLGGYEEASILLEKLVVARSTHWGVDSPETLRLVYQLLECYSAKGDSKQEKLQTLLEHCKSLYGGTSSNNMAVLALKGRMYQLQGLYEKAEDVYRELIETGRVTFGDFSPRNLNAVQMLAELLQKTGKHVEVEDLLRQYVRLGHNLDGVAGEHMLSLLTLLGEAKLRQGHPDEALPILETAYNAPIDRYGDFWLRVSRKRQLLAECLVQQKQYMEAESLIREELKYSHQMETNTSVSMTSPSALLGICLFEQTQYSEAESILKEAYHKGKEASRAKHAESCRTLCYLILSLEKTGALEQAKSLIQDMFELYEHIEGDLNTPVLWVLSTFAEILERQKRVTEAEIVCRCRDEKVKEFSG
ncbi:SubName: Full=Uncharacterized protein {ECO:0000313/EMBL:CCA74053.1} [Serendipita indica DSM 11827]|nr:SubName: Full=Uncharacterized protein {ECO:0000313/EMBL:CCA74053.1} [Serendipita indica DSM 11827]